MKDDWENTEDPSTPNLTSKAPNCGRPSNQSKLDPSGLPAGVSSHQQFFLNGKARAIVSSPINLDSQSAESGDDDIVSSTARRARVKKSAIAISNDTESKDSGLKSPLRSGKKLHIIQDSQSRPYISHPPIPRPHSPDRVAKYGLDSGSHLHKSVTSIKTQKNMSQRRLRGFDASVSGQSPKKHQTRSMARTAPNPSQDLPELVFSDKDEEDSDIVLVSPARKRRSEVENSKKGRIIEDDVDEESEDEIRPSPVKRRGRVARPEPEDGGDLDHQPQREFDAVKSSSQQEQEDLEEDLEDLQQSSKHPTC